MSAVEAEFAVAIGTNPLVPLDIERPCGQRAQDCLFLGKECRNGPVFLVVLPRMVLQCLLEQLRIPVDEPIDYRQRHKEIPPGIADLVLHIAFLMAGIGVAETDGKPVVALETQKKLVERYMLLDLAADTGGIIEYNAARYAAKVPEDIL